MKSMENKQGYKKTKIGWIPEDWETKYLKDLILNLKAGKSVNCKEGEDYPDGKRILKTSAITASGLNIREVKAPLNSEVSLLSQSIIKNRLLVCRKNTPEKVGKSVITTSTYEEIYLPDLIWQTEPTSLEHDLQFLNYILSTPFFRYRIQCLANGSSKSMVNISKPSFLGIQIPFPEHSEQQKIATILFTWDKAMDKLSDLIEVKEEQKKGLMQQLLTGKVRLKRFDKKWQERKLGEVFSERKETRREDLELLSIGSKGVYPQSESNKKDTSNSNKDKYKRICKGDIGYNTMRMWQGRSAVSFIEGIVSPAYTIVTPKEEHNVNFFGYLFHTPDLIHRFWRYSQGLVGDTLNCKFNSFSKVKVLVPPTTEEQKEIAAVLDQITLEIETLEKKRTIYELEKKGLMQQLLTGKRRVKIK